MSLCRYTAKDRQGNTFTGTYDNGTGVSALRSELSKIGYRLVKVHKEGQNNTTKVKIKPKEIVAFAYMFAGMYQAGLTVIRCLESMEEQTDNPALKEVISDIRENVETGSSLKKAFKPYEHIFSTFFVGMIEAGETGGELIKSLNLSAVYLEKRLELRHKVMSAFAYPAVVCVVCLLVISGLLVFVVPMFSKIYARLHVPLPGPTQTLIFLSVMIRQYWYLIIGAVVGSISLFKYLIKDPARRAKVDALKLQVPLFGRLNRLVAVSRFIRTFSTLMAVGVPIIESMEVARQVVGNQRMSDIAETVRESVRSGHTMAQALKAHSIFPSVIVQMADSGEEAGVLAEMMNKGAEFLDKDIDRIIDSLLVKLEPALTLIMGSVVGLCLMAVYLPMFDYMNHLH